MVGRTFMRALLVTCLVACCTRTSAAQSLGTFRWQALPFCNVITLTVEQVGGIFTLDGFDDQCGAATRASVVGTAFFNPDGSVGIGLTTIATPGGEPVHTDVTLSLATIGGPWRDSIGHSGTFVFNPVSASGSPRPIPVAGANVPASQFSFSLDGGLVARGQQGIGDLRAKGAGTRMVWHPAKAAFRAGVVTGSHWDEANVGLYSVALGRNAIATGVGSVALGGNPQAIADGSAAIGSSSAALGQDGIAIGSFATASGISGTALGFNTSAEGNYSTAIGYEASASGDLSVALGYRAETDGWVGGFVFGDASSAAAVVASANNQFTVRSAGGTRFFSNAGMTMGVKLDAGAGAWTQVSDVARKRNFRDLDGEDVLHKLRAMPIREWSYIAQDPAIRHVGPTAQDFHAAFGLGEDPLGITTVDAEGIALRAIQALEARTSALAEENRHLAAENETLSRALEDVRRELTRLLGRERR